MSVLSTSIHPSFLALGSKWRAFCGENTKEFAGEISLLWYKTLHYEKIDKTTLSFWLHPILFIERIFWEILVPEKVFFSLIKSDIERLVIPLDKTAFLLPIEFIYWDFSSFVLVFWFPGALRTFQRTIWLVFICGHSLTWRNFVLKGSILNETFILITMSLLIIEKYSGKFSTFPFTRWFKGQLVYLEGLRWVLCEKKFNKIFSKVFCLVKGNLIEYVITSLSSRKRGKT